MSNFLACVKPYRWLPTYARGTLNVKFMASVLISVPKSVFHVEECKELQCSSFEFMRVPHDPGQLQSQMPQSAVSHHCLAQRCWEVRIAGFPGWRHGFRWAFAARVLELLITEQHRDERRFPELSFPVFLARRKKQRSSKVHGCFCCLCMD